MSVFFICKQRRHISHILYTDGSVLALQDQTDFWGLISCRQIMDGLCMFNKSDKYDLYSEYSCSSIVMPRTLCLRVVVAAVFLSPFAF